MKDKSKCASNFDCENEDHKHKDQSSVPEKHNVKKKAKSTSKDASVRSYLSAAASSVEDKDKDDTEDKIYETPQNEDQSEEQERPAIDAEDEELRKYLVDYDIENGALYTCYEDSKKSALDIISGFKDQTTDNHAESTVHPALSEDNEAADGYAVDKNGVNAQSDIHLRQPRNYPIINRRGGRVPINQYVISEEYEDDEGWLWCYDTRKISKLSGFVKVTAKIPKRNADGTEYEVEFDEWYKARSPELREALISLKNDDAFDCRISLAEYKKPKLEQELIERINKCIVYIPDSTKLHPDIESSLLEVIGNYCFHKKIPVPSQIYYVVSGYYLVWEFKDFLLNVELPIWNFIQETLKRCFDELGAYKAGDIEATSMIFLPDFPNSSKSPDKAITKKEFIDSDECLYPSAREFLVSVPLLKEDILNYREIVQTLPKRVYRSKMRISEEEPSLPFDTLRKQNYRLFQNLTSDFKGMEGYKFWQRKEVECAGKKKYYNWLSIDNGRSDTVSLFMPDLDNWVSAAVFGESLNYFTKKIDVRKEEKYVISVNCNFVILDWTQSILNYIPTPEESVQIILSECREHGLPEPQITYIGDGVEVKWFWCDTMDKEEDGTLFFNSDWNKMQEELYKKFWHLGAVENGILTMFRIPGSVNTRKKLGTKDRLVRDIHQAEKVNSYEDMQMLLEVWPSMDELYGEEFIKSEDYEDFSLVNSTIAKDWEKDVFRIHPFSNNWVCISMLSKGKWVNRYEKACNLPLYLMELVDSPERMVNDIYISQGEFLRPHNRKVSNLASIRVNFVDLDYKLLVQYHPEIKENPSPDEWVGLVQTHCSKYNIPEPNDVVFTGGGVHLKWIHTEDIHSRELEYWSYAQELLLTQFRTLGADPASVDASRVLRLVGTFNQKESPIIKEREVFVAHSSANSRHDNLTVKGLIADLEASRPVDIDAIKAVYAEWKLRKQESWSSKAEEIQHFAELEKKLTSEETARVEDIWKNSLSGSISDGNTYFRVKIPDWQGEWIRRYQLKDFLKTVLGKHDVMMSLAEYETNKTTSSIAWIPCNYVMLSRCPGSSFEEQKAVILERCRNYRDVGIPEANEIIKAGNYLLVKWKYIEPLPGYAISRWNVTQEYLCRYFEDWGAMDKPEYLTASVLLPLPYIYYGGVTSSLEYGSFKRYSFDVLATAVLHFSQLQVKEYELEKIAKSLEKEEKKKYSRLGNKLLNMADSSGKVCYGKKGFAGMALRRLEDIITLLEMRKGNNGEVPEGCRELCVLWASVSALQAGLVSSYDEFKEKVQYLINLCGEEFARECDVKIFSSAYKKTYRITTAKLMNVLKITPEEESRMQVLRHKRIRRKYRKDWLSDHAQERNKPWEALGISRATYFRRKKAEISSHNREIIDVVRSFEKKIETGIHYIMKGALHVRVDLCDDGVNENVVDDAWGGHCVDCGVVDIVDTG